MKLTRTLALFLFVPLLFFGSTSSVEALSFSDYFQTNNNIENQTNKTIEAIVKSADEGTPSLNSFTDDISISWQTSAYLAIAGPPENSAEFQSLTEEQKRIVYERYGRGMIGEITNAVATLYNPPASSQSYIADLLHSAHIIPQAQAQGLGFASLDPILETWKIFRNVAYLFFVAIFLVIGFMIMFRQKIGGQTVVTAQQAIPGVIVALIFVTFSYAIAGFLIDLMYLLMYLILGIFQPPGGSELIGKNIFFVGWDLITGANGSSAFQSVNDAVKTMASAIDTGLVGDVLGWIGGITLGLIISIAILIGVFKIFFELLKTYIVIVIAIVTAPLNLMLGAVPGKGNFGQWIKLIFGNLMAFPVVLIALIFYQMFTNTDLGSGGFVPPYLIGRGQGSVILTMVGIGLVLMIPELIKEIKKVFGAEAGIWETLAGAAIAQAREGAPIGSKLVGVAGGAAVGTLGGLGRGLWETRGDTSGLLARAGRVLQYTGRGTGNAMATGLRVGGTVSTALGGKTPSVLAPVETFVDTAGGWVSDEERLKRIRERRGFFGDRTGANARIEDRELIAKREADKSLQEEERLKRGLYGQLVTPGSPEEQH